MLTKCITEGNVGLRQGTFICILMSCEIINMAEEMHYPLNFPMYSANGNLRVLYNKRSCEKLYDEPFYTMPQKLKWPTESMQDMMGRVYFAGCMWQVTR